MHVPGDLIASGRDADIYEYDKFSVLRRSRSGRSQAHEVDAMVFAHASGYPVPHVMEMSDDGVDVVMEKIEGPTMIEAIASRPWRLTSFARDLAQLHDSLHLLAAPGSLPAAPCSPGDRFLHLDLHPLNVILSKRGPVVIDWANAARGDPLVDVALTWALLASADVPSGRLQAAMTSVGRSVFARAFLRTISTPGVSSVLSCVVEWKCQDDHMSAAEISRMRALL